MCFFESLFDFLPVYHLPYVLKEVCFGVLVINVEGMLPNVDVKQRYKTIRLLVSDQVLVCSGSVLKALGSLIVNEPSPSTALNSCGLSTEPFLELIITTPTSFDEFWEFRIFTRTLATTILDRSQRLPEESVVPVATPEKSNLTGDPCDGLRIIFRLGLLDLL